VLNTFLTVFDFFYISEGSVTRQLRWGAEMTNTLWQIPC